MNLLPKSVVFNIIKSGLSYTWKLIFDFLKINARLNSVLVKEHLMSWTRYFYIFYIQLFWSIYYYLFYIETHIPLLFLATLRCSFSEQQLQSLLFSIHCCCWCKINLFRFQILLWTQILWLCLRSLYRKAPRRTYVRLTISSNHPNIARCCTNILTM